MKAQTFSDIVKFNPYHDSRGRFSSAGAAGAVTDTEWMTWAFDAEPIKEFVQDGVITTQYDSTGHKITDEEREEFKVIGAKIQEAAQNGRIPDRILYRGESYDTIDEFKEKYKYNKKIETATITSTSPDIEVARAYADGVEAPVQVVVRFNNVNGHKGVHTEPMGVPSNEIVLPKGEQYRVSRIIDEGNNRFTVDLYSKEKHGKIKKTDDTQQFHIMKTDDEKRLIFGWASVAIKIDGEQVVDHQKDMIDPEDLEEAVYEYVLNFRDGGEEHIATLRKKARMVESCMFTKEKMQAMGIPEGIVPEGWWIGFYVDDDDAWEKVKSGIYQMFSIEGKGVREEVEDDEDVKKNDSIETSSVAKTFDEICKINLLHDALGRFASRNSSASPGGKKSPAGNKKGADWINTEKQSGHHPKTYSEMNEKAFFNQVMDETQTDKETARKMYDAVQSYSGGFSKEIQAAQKKAESGEELNDTEKTRFEEGEALELLIQRSPKWAGGELHRGVNVSKERAEEILRKVESGEELDMGGTSSWTSNKIVANEYAGIGSKGKVEIVYHTNAGETTKGTSIRHMSQVKSEDEVLMSKNARYNGTKIEEDKATGKIHIYVDEK